MDFDKCFDEDYRNTLQEIQSYFQENLSSNIQSDTERMVRRKYEPKVFPDVGFVAQDKSILFKNITLLTCPQVTMEKFEVDFRNQCLQMAFNFPKLQVSTSYELHSVSEGDVITKSGNMKFTFSLNTSGQVGIFFTEDSFTPKTYDLEYNINGVQLETSESLDLFKFDLKDQEPIERQLMSIFWPALEDSLFYEIYRLVAGNVVEYSVSELLIDEPEHLKKYAVERIGHGNVFIQQCLNDFNNILEKQSNFKSSDTFVLKLQNNEGELKCKEAELSQPILTRIYDTSFANINGEDYYYAHCNIEDFQYIFANSVVKNENETFTGDVIVKPYRNKISFKVVVSGGKKQLSVKLLDIMDWDFEVKPKNEGIVNFVEYKIKPYLIGYVWHHTESFLQKFVEQFNTED